MFKTKVGGILQPIALNKICRICLKNSGTLTDINNTHIPEIIQKCANVQVSEKDGLPDKICRRCLSTLIEYNTFRKRIEESDGILRKYLKTSLQKNHYDILNIALNEAEIQTIPDSSIHNNAVLIASDFDDANGTDKVSASNNIYGDKVHFISDGGPPPLVPFEPSSDKSNESVPTSVHNLPKNTPPLIPIKPITNIDILMKPEIEASKYQSTKSSAQLSSLVSLKEHKLSTCQLGVLQCNICNKKFKESVKLIGHLKGHMVAKAYKCEICHKAYPNPSTLTIHMRTHTGERPFKCDLCGKGFIRWAGLAGHMKVHASEKSYICDTCGRCFKNRSNLTRHKLRHNKDSPFLCSFCDKTFNQSDNLQVHIKMHHTNEKQFLCSKCGKSFVNSTRLKRHMWVHSGFKPHTCRTCHKQYSNLSDLRNHEIRAHLGRNPDEYKKYCCDKCSLRFFHPSRLARHKISHKISNICRDCGKNFPEEESLENHIQDKHGMNFLVKANDDNFKILVEFQEDQESLKIENEGLVEKSFTNSVI